MSKLQTHERFKDARLIHNRHGKQTMAEVEKATGISQSLICDLEKDPSESIEQQKRPRRVGYQTVADLAAYYGVSSDWLLGLSDVWSTEATLKAACEYTGLSENIIERLHNVFISNEPHLDGETGEIVYTSKWCDIGIEKIKALFNEYGTSKEAEQFFQTLTAVNENKIEEMKYFSDQQHLALLFGASVMSGAEISPSWKSLIEDAARKMMPDLKAGAKKKAYQEWHDLTLFKIQQAAIAFADYCICENMKKWGFAELLRSENEGVMAKEEMKPYTPNEGRGDNGNDQAE